MMRIDRTTQAELQLLQSRDGRAGVLGVLDRTRTQAGRRALRRRMDEPMVDASAIREVQDAVAFLAARRRPFRIEDRILTSARRYLESRIVLARGTRVKTWIDEVWSRLRYRDLVRELESGRAAVLALHHMARGVARELSTAPESDPSGPPEVLARYGARLDASATSLRAALSGRSLLWSDRRIRGEEKDAVRDVIDVLGEIDALQSMALAGSAPGWSRPEILDREGFLLEAEDAFHPFVSDPTPNPIRLTGGEPLVFLTGPNMGGKTTYLRTVALTVLLAQMGMNVPARTLRLSPVEALLTSLEPSDDLRAGVSYFKAEVLRVKEAATLLAEGRRALVLFDEVFKGTNVRDALDASARVIEGFARTRRSGAIFSSHLTELAETLAGNPSIRFSRFEGELRDGRPSFTFRLEPGVSRTRFGMLLLEEAEVPALIARIGVG